MVVVLFAHVFQPLPTASFLRVVLVTVFVPRSSAFLSATVLRVLAVKPFPCLFRAFALPALVLVVAATVLVRPHEAFGSAAVARVLLVTVFAGFFSGFSSSSSGSCTAGFGTGGRRNGFCVPTCGL